MESRILYVYYGVDRLPYKDPQCQVHFPNVGSVINGASEVDTIVFDVSKIGGTSGHTFVSITTLPSGKKLYKTLSGENNQVSLSLTQAYTMESGDITISLNGYLGGEELVVDEDSGVISVEGNPIIVATGSIKISVAYTPTMPSDYNPVEAISVQEALALVSTKADTDYVKYGRLNTNLTIEDGISVVPLSEILVDDEIDAEYEPSDEYVLNEYFENGLPLGIYDAQEEEQYILTSAPTLYKEEFSSPSSLVAVYRYEPYGGGSVSGTYLLLFISPNKKFYFSSYSTSQEIEHDEYASKGLVDTLITRYGTNGNVITISSLPSTLSATNQTKIKRLDCVILLDTFTGDDNGFYYRAEESTSLRTITFKKLSPIVREISNSGVLTTSYKTLTYSDVSHTLSLTSDTRQVYLKSKSDILFGVSLTIDSDYKLYLKNSNGANISVVDLPLESVVVGGSYDDTTETIILTLQNGQTIDIPVHDLVSGLATTSQLESGLATKVDKVQGKGLSTNDFTDADKTKLDNSATTSDLASKQDTLVSGTNIKTINNESILGSGNITIQSGGGSWGSITGDIDDQTDLQNELQAIREEAEGKTQTFTLSYLDTVAVVQAYLTANPDKKIVDESGNDITSDFLNNEYSGIIDNSIFSSTNSILTPTSPSYLLVETIGNERPADVSYYLVDITKIKTGDIILVVEDTLNGDKIPDRWYRASDTSFYAWDASKIDLSNYATKDQAFNVIDASDIVNNTLTQAQYDLITNGKPTLIKGTLFSLTNTLMTPLNIGGTYANGNFIATNQYGQGENGIFYINISTKVIAITRLTTYDRNGTFYIRDKAFPSYPSNTGTFVLKCVDGVLTWVQEV